MTTLVANGRTVRTGEPGRSGDVRSAEVGSDSFGSGKVGGVVDLEDVFDPTGEDLGEAEGEREGRIEAVAFDRDHGLSGDSELFGQFSL
jgi:hypothetical protein